MAMTQNNSNNSLTPELNDLCSKKEIIWMNSLAYRPRLKKDLYSKFRLGPKIRTSRKAQSGIQAKIHSWSTIHCVFKICKSAQFMAKIHNPCTFQGHICQSENLFTPSSIRIWLMGITYGLLTKCEVKMAGYWPSSFFACLWTETESRSINSQKKNEDNFQPSWPNKLGQ